MGPETTMEPETTMGTEPTTAMPETTTMGTSCDDFQEGVCPLDEDNIVGSDRFSPDPEHCQDLCRYV